MNAMPDNNSKSRVLAHWHFTNELWREYLYYEKLEFESNTFVDLRMILTSGVAVLSIVAIFGGMKGGPAVFFFALIAGSLFFGFCYLIHRLVRKSAEQRLQTQTGEVKITKIWVDINGVIFDWRGHWSLPQIYKDYTYIGDEKMLLLNFTCNGWMYVKGEKEPVEKKCLIPVPPGKETEADLVITEITKNFFKK
ncbi:MAG: hypothetical protein LC768_05880 [Acidobacteria bacterium]|nr:hypothetical protein [Acidobacteriota bacterium]MCA1637852.1 hypothetical protein [Acidobacteriota bacterium]